MTKQIQIWKLIADSVDRKVPVMLLYVLESLGSSPGRQGFFMAVSANGEMEGSIGGGIMEHKFVELAKERMKNIEQVTRNKESASIRKQIHDKSAANDQSGMICSGEQTILLYPVKEKDATHIRDLISSLEKNKSGTLILSPKGIRFGDNIPEKDFSFEMKSGEDWQYIEKTGYKNQLTIIGGGHCSLAFSKLMYSMDFYIRVYDERKELKTMVENEVAHEKYFVSDYSELGKHVGPGINHYVVIMTFGYRTDDLALRALLGKEFRYIGLLGSKTKVEKMFEAYRSEGIKEEWLQLIHTPIGLAIKSQTPEEIAISIAAEIIQEKNKG